MKFGTYVTEWVSSGHFCLPLCSFGSPFHALVVITRRGVGCRYMMRLGKLQIGSNYWKSRGRCQVYGLRGICLMIVCVIWLVMTTPAGGGITSWYIKKNILYATTQTTHAHSKTVHPWVHCQDTRASRSVESFCSLTPYASWKGFHLKGGRSQKNNGPSKHGRIKPQINMHALWLSTPSYPSSIVAQALQSSLCYQKPPSIYPIWPRSTPNPTSTSFRH